MTEGFPRGVAITDLQRTDIEWELSANTDGGVRCKVTFDLSKITWDTIAALATLAAVIAALIPIWAEARRRKAHAKNLRIRMRAKLTLLRPSIGKVNRRGYAEYPTAVLTREQFREVVRSIESMMQETDVLSPEEQDRLAKVFTNLEVTVPLYETEAFEVSSAENVLMWIDEARNTMDQHGILHAPIGAPWRK